MLKKIFIFDTTLRDGEQVPGASLNPSEKLEIARQLALLGVDVIEIGFPASGMDDFEAAQTIAEDIKGPTTICALARCIESDIQRAGEALRAAEKARLHVFVGTSPIHRQGQLKKSKAEVLEMAVRAVRQAKEWCPEVEFSPMDATRTEPSYLCEVIRATIEAGANIINIADTVGYAVPAQFARLIRFIQRKVAGIDKVMISVHCHNDLDMATSNSLAGVKAGARQVECTIGGIGERAGNAPLEAIVMAIRSRKDYFRAYTDVRAELITNTFLLVSQLMGLPVSPNKAIVGTNAFAHSSGVHQDGVLKRRETFEIIKPEDVGAAPSQIILTSRSGRHALRHCLEKLGYEFSREQINEVYGAFLLLASKKKQVGDDDLRALVGMALRGGGACSVVDVLVIFNQEEGLYKASLRVQKGKEEIAEWEGSANDGPVDAIVQAIRKGTQTSFELLECVTKSVGEGSDAQAQVVVKLRCNGRISRGIGLNTDTLKATASACLDAVMRAAPKKEGGEGG